MHQTPHPRNELPVSDWFVTFKSKIKTNFFTNIITRGHFKFDKEIPICSNKVMIRVIYSYRISKHSI